MITQQKKFSSVVHNQFSLNSRGEGSKSPCGHKGDSSNDHDWPSRGWGSNFSKNWPHDLRMTPMFYLGTYVLCIPSIKRA